MRDQSAHGERGWGATSDFARRHRGSIGGICFALAAGVILLATLTTTRDSVLSSVMLAVAGSLIGLTLIAFFPSRETATAQAPQSRFSPRARGWAYSATSAFCFVGYVLFLVLARETSSYVGAAFMVLFVGVPALGAGLNRFYPGPNRPSGFLLPFFTNAAMLSVIALQPKSAENLPLWIVTFGPSLVVAFISTLWAFQIRNAPYAQYVKGTEVARGIALGWFLLGLVGITFGVFGQPIPEDFSSSLTPLLTLITVGSVVAVATSGYSQFVEVRAQLAAAVTSGADDVGLLPDFGFPESETVSSPWITNLSIRFSE